MFIKNPALASDPKTGKFSYSVEDFTDVGQDSFSTPPSEDPGQWHEIYNIMPVTSGGLKRRRGYSNFLEGNGVPYGLVNTLVSRMFNFQRDSDGFRSIVVASGGDESAVGGPSQQPVITAFDDSGNFYSDVTVLQSRPRMITSRNFAYFFSGTSGDTVKWDGSVNSDAVSPWGISVNGSLPATVDTQSPTLADGGTKWVNPANALNLDGNYASTVIGAAQTDNILTLSDFGFAIPGGSTILKIYVRLSAFCNHIYPSPGQAVLYYHLTKAGVAYGSNWQRTITNFLASYLDDPGLWGGIWTADDINDPGFGITIHAGNLYNDHVSSTFFVDGVELLVQYVPSNAIVATVGGVGGVNLTVGRKYYTVFQNSKTGHLSDLNSPSTTSGPCTNSEIDLSGIVVSADDQVDTKLLLATSDGGDPNSLYLLAEIANGITTYIDNTPEEVLVTNQLYFFIDDFGNEFGCAGNTPPPLQGKYCVKHRGRLWMLDQQNLFFSKAVSDLTLPNGLVAGKYEESWPADNYFDVSEGAESGTGLLSDGQTLYIGTERHVLRLLGDDPTNFTQPEIVHPEVGVVNQEVWQLIYLEGTPAGAMWLTPDCKVIASDFSSYIDAGNPVQDILNRINRTTVSTVAHAQFLADGPLNLFVLSIPVDDSIQPNVLLVYNIKTKRWCVWSPTDVAHSLLYNVDSQGNSRWLMGSNGFVFEFQESDLQDESQQFGNTDIPCRVTTSWMEFGSSMYRKMLDELEVIGESDLSVSIYGASTDADFDSPVTIAINRPLTTGPFNTLKCYLYTLTTKYKFYRFTFFGTSNLTNKFLDAYSVTGSYFNTL